MSAPTNYPLTELQRSYVIGRDEEEIATKVIYETRVREFDQQRFEEAIQKVIMEQPALNAVFSEQGNFVIRDTIKPFHISTTDISFYTEDEKQKYMDKMFEKTKLAIWNGKEDYPITISAYRLSDEETRLLLDFDMIIFDGMSIKLFLDKVESYYEDCTKIPEVDNRFLSYCAALSEKENSKRYQRAKDYWLNEEKRFPPAPDILHNNVNFSGENAVFERCTLTLDKNEWKTIKNNIEKQKIQPYVMMLSLYAKMIGMYSGASSFTVNVPVTARKSADKETLGDFTSVLLVDINLKQKNLLELCDAIQKNILHGLKNRSFDGVEVMRNLAGKETEGDGRFPVVFTPMLYDDFCISDTSPIGIIVRGCSQTTNVLLDCQIYEYQKDLIINVDYRKKSYDKTNIDRMFSLFCEDIRAIADEEILADETFLTRISSEDEKTIAAYNDTFDDIPVHSLMELLPKSFARHRDKVAVSCGEETITFGELWKCSDQVCGYLLEQGVCRGDTVAVIGSRTIKTMIHFLGVIKCGAIYVPIDVSQPEYRKNAILRKAECKAVLTETTDTETYHGACSENPVDSPEDIAYIIFTSGSTGEPKGVYVKHSAALNTVLDMNKRYQITEEDVLACVSSIGFDLSIYDIFGSFLSGAELALVPDVYNVEEMIKVLSERGVTIWNSVPAIFGLVVDYLRGKEKYRDELFDDYLEEAGDALTHHILSLRLVLLSGDWIPKNMVADAMELFADCLFVSLGGATEASIWSISYDITAVNPEWKSIPYGYPLANQKIYILNSDQEIMPIGARGEICIGGVGVAEGYYHDPEKTALQFQLHEKYGKLYHTGDFGYMSEKGYVVFLGRKDNQVKINGFRVELGEIENVIKKLSYVENAVALIAASQNGSKAICAYVSLKKATDVDTIRRDAADHLPHYMIPSRIIIMDHLPLTTNGKINRKALPNPYEQKVVIEKAKDEFENRLTEMWEKYLKTEGISVDGHFIELGGDSLSMISIVNEIKDQFHVEISFKKFMILGTIREIANYIKENTDTAIESSYEIYSPVICDEGNRQAKFPLTDIQLSYFIGRSAGMELGSISTHAYYEIENNFDIPRLNKALNRVIAENPMLRMVITPDGMQKILDHVEEYKIPEEDICELSAEEKEIFLKEQRDEHSHKVIDVHTFPLFEFQAIRLSAEKVRLLVGFDLLISDGLSMRIFIKELMRHYKDEFCPAKTVDFDFHDYILSLNQLKETEHYRASESYWEKQINTFSGAPSLPMIASPNEVRKPVFQRCRHRISAEKWKTIRECLLQYGITPSTYLLTIYGKILAYYSNRECVTLNVTTFTRFPFHEAVQNMMGDFTSVMLMDVKGSGKLQGTCKELQEKIAENLEHKDYDGVSVIRNIAKKENRGGELLFPYVFTGMIFENQEAFHLEDVGKVVFDISQTSQVYLDCQVMSENEGISITWDYVLQLFDPNMMEQMFGEFVNCIEQPINLLKKSVDLRDFIGSHEFINTYNDTAWEFENSTLIRAFEENVEKQPDRIAVVANGREVTYRELNDMAERITYCLEESGINKGERVAIYEYRNENTVAAILAILKCGAVYVPISPEIPEERKNYIIENAEISVELTCEKVESFLKNTKKNKVHASPDGSEEAYIIYTSGSTGRPKGVVMTHACAMNTIMDVNRKFKVDNRDVILGVSSFTFDLSVYDLFGTFLAGGKLVLAQNSKDAESIKALLSDNAVTIWNSVPAIFSFLLHADEEFPEYFDEADMETEIILEDTESLRLVLLSGDYIPVDLPDCIRKTYQNAEVISLGGATEGGIWSIYYPIKEVDPRWSVIPYGFPLANQQMYVLDRENRCCPMLVEGEIAIGGDSLATGYCNDQAKTEAAFIHHPELGKIYKTGDMGAFHPDGYIEFRGRKDNQVKINGYRIELGEIESSMVKMENITAAVAVVMKSNKNTIAAFYTSEKEIPDQDIKDFLETKIPTYMIPAVLKRVDRIPITANGKVDRKALSEKDILENSRIIVPPSTENEKVLYNYFKEALEVDEFSVKDSFFELGGDSIKGIHMFNKLSEEYDLELNLIFRYQSVEQLAKHIKKREHAYIDERMDQFKKEYYNLSDDSDSQHIDEMYATYLNECFAGIPQSHQKDNQNIQSILITGATGYLGAFIVEKILKGTSADIYLPVRGDQSEKRLYANLVFYFGESLITQYADRMHCVFCDLAKPKLGMEDTIYDALAKKIEHVINCAGKVQHIGKYEDFEESNVDSVRNLITFCKTGRKKVLHHLSTTRVSENIPSENGVLFSEYTIPETMESEEFYVQTKKEAEDLMLDAVREGMDGRIYRIGTVLFDSRNGRFQKNIESNSFYLIMQAFFDLGAMPDIDAELLDFTFVDQCAEAIVKLVCEAGMPGEIYHIYNPHKISMRGFYNMLKEAGMKEKMDIMEFENFFDFVYEKYKDETMKPCIDTLLLHSGSYLSLDEGICAIVNDRTCRILDNCSFQWPQVTESHVKDMLAYGQKVDFFKDMI